MRPTKGIGPINKSEFQVFDWGIYILGLMEYADQ
jgi:hypothetical protein